MGRTQGSCRNNIRNVECDISYVINLDVSCTNVILTDDLRIFFIFALRFSPSAFPSFFASEWKLVDKEAKKAASENKTNERLMGKKNRIKAAALAF